MPSIELSIHYRPEAIENSELNYSITSFVTHTNLLSSLCRLVDGGTAVDHAPAWTSFSMKHWANLNLFNFGIVHWTENNIGIRLYSDGEPNELNRLHRSLSRATQAFDVSRLYSNRFGLISILRMRHAHRTHEANGTTSRCGPIHRCIDWQAVKRSRRQCVVNVFYLFFFFGNSVSHANNKKYSVLEATSQSKANASHSIVSVVFVCVTCIRWIFFVHNRDTKKNTDLRSIDGYFWELLYPVVYTIDICFLRTQKPKIYPFSICSPVYFLKAIE